MIPLVFPVRDVQGILRAVQAFPDAGKVILLTAIGSLNIDHGDSGPQRRRQLPGPSIPATPWLTPEQVPR